MLLRTQQNKDCHFFFIIDSKLHLYISRMEFMQTLKNQGTLPYAQLVKPMFLP